MAEEGEWAVQRLQRVDDGLGVRRKRLERRLGSARAPAGWLDHPHLDDVRKRRPRVVAGGAGVASHAPFACSGLNPGSIAGDTNGGSI